MPNLFRLAASGTQGDLDCMIAIPECQPDAPAEHSAKMMTDSASLSRRRHIEGSFFLRRNAL
jgi:hypothetical protein